MCVKVPEPTLLPGHVLIRVKHSFVSVGTETAPLKESLSATEPKDSKFVTTARTAKLAAHYAYLSVLHPDKAVRRLRLMADGYRRRLSPAPIEPDGTPAPPQVRSDAYAQGWGVGYSAAGTVVALGAGVSSFNVGDLVAAAGAGLANHADFICVPKNLVCRVPDNCTSVQACTATVGAIAMQAARRASATIGETVAVIGLGLIGQILARILASSGCQVIAFEPNAERTAAYDGGNDITVTNDVQEFQTLIMQRTHNFGVDVTFVAAATKSSDPSNLALRTTRRRGTVVIVGAVGMNFERPDFYLKEIDVLMSTSYGPGRYDREYETEGHDYPYAYVRWTLNRNMQSYLALVANKKLNIDEITNEIVYVEQAPNAYARMLNADVPPIAVVFSYDAVPARANGAALIEGAKKASEGALSFALVGVGAFGVSMIVPRLRAHKQNFQMRAVVSTDTVRGGNYARQEQVEVLASSIEQVTAQTKIDAVVIASRHNRHAEQVISALKQDLHVFVEKPLALTWDELEEISAVHAEKSPKASLSVGFNRRFAPAIQKLSEILTNRKTPMVIHYRMNSGHIPPDHWVQTNEGGGRNIGEACHIYDVFRFLASAQATSISATSINPKELSSLRNDNFSSTISYADGSVATLVYTALGPKEGLGKERMEIFCDGEAYVLDDYKSLTQASSGETLWSANQADKGHDEEIIRFGHFVAEGGTPIIPFDQIIEASATALSVEDLLHGRMIEDVDLDN